MADDWYHIAQTPDGIHVHCLGAWDLANYAAEVMETREDIGQEEAVSMAVTYYAEAIRRELGFPPELSVGNGWSSTVSPGEPHPNTLMREDVTVHEELPR